MMGGATTVWIALDLLQQHVLSRLWLLLGIMSRACAVVAPFLQFNLYLLLIGLICWLTWCLWLSTRHHLPSPFPTWPDT
jgi:hypothetical protein